MDPVAEFLANAAKAIGVRGGIAIALGLALAVTMWRADSISEARDKAEDQVVVETTKHAVTAASLDALELRLAAMVADGELRAERLSKAQAEVAKETAPLRAQADAFERGEIDISELQGL